MERKTRSKIRDRLVGTGLLCLAACGSRTGLEQSGMGEPFGSMADGRRGPFVNGDPSVPPGSLDGSVGAGAGEVVNAAGIGAAGAGSDAPGGCRGPRVGQVRSLALGDAYTCALLTNGGVRCWGRNQYGQLGDGTTTDRVAPPDSDVLSGVQAIATGLGHTCALMATGGVRCWGVNFFGQLGDGTGSDRLSPPSADVLSGVQAIVTGEWHTCALMNTGGVRCWGSNERAQLGDNSIWNDRSIPDNSDILAGVRSLVAGKAYTCALMTTGGIRCWGDNSYGQLGDGTTTIRRRPPPTDLLAGVQAMAASDARTCVLMATAGVRCWGRNPGTDQTSFEANPPTADVLTGVQSISAGGGHVCALTTTGGVRCWGDNTYGQLGNGTTQDLDGPVASDVLTDAQAVYAGGSHSCALLASGAVACWGSNDYGQLGDGTTTKRWTPNPVSGFCP